MRRFGWVLVLARLLVGRGRRTCDLRDVPDYLLPAPDRRRPGAVGRPLEPASPGAASRSARCSLGFALALASGLRRRGRCCTSCPLRGAVHPLLIASQSVPVVAIAPILVIYLGFGLAPKLLIVALVCFFPITVNALDGLERVDPEYRRMLRTLDADAGRQIFRRVELPWSLPGDLRRRPDRRLLLGRGRAVRRVRRRRASGLVRLDARGTASTPPWSAPRSSCWPLLALALYGVGRAGRAAAVAPWARGRDRLTAGQPFAGESRSGLRGRDDAPTRRT